MRATAQIKPITLFINFQGLIGGDRIHQLNLKGLALHLKEVLGLVAGPFLAGEGGITGNNLAHFLLDRRKFFRRERRCAIKIVIKAVFNHRPDSNLRAGIQGLHRLGQHMGAIMPDQLQRARVIAVQKFNFCIGFNNVGKICDRTVQRHGNRALGEGGRNPLHYIEATGASGKAALIAIRECYMNHICLLMLTR